MNRFFKITLFIGYLIATAGVFLYIQFPSETFSRYFSSIIESSYPGIRITMTRMYPMLPLGVSIASGAVSYQDVSLVHADTVRFKPMLMSIFKPEKQIQFLGSAHEGRFNGTIEWIKNSHRVQYRLDAGLSGMEMKEIPILQTLSNKRLSGRCDGRIEYRTDAKAASAQMKVFDCKFELATPMANITSLSFQQVLATLAFDGRRLGIKEVIFKGRQLDGRLSGSITFQKPIGKSVMKLSGEVKPHPGFFSELGSTLSTPFLSKRSQGEAEMTFTIEGTIENPIFSF